MSTKYVFVTGGVVSALGKGITAASLGRLLKARGLRVCIQKMDPYMNISPARMSPYEHGEVFVTHDGAETDLDIGHYERFTDEEHDKNSNCTAGRIYDRLLDKERNGEAVHGTIQVIPHITNEIKERIRSAEASMNPDVVITEIGGTVGDMESLTFLEAIRQMRLEMPPQSCVNIHVTLVLYLNAVGELKTKPTQHSVKELLSLGIQPDIMVCRTEVPMGEDIRNKLSLYCNLRPQDVVENSNCDCLYEVPLLLHQDGLDDRVCEALGLSCPPPDLSEWEEIVARYKNPAHKLRVAIVGSYVELHDAYLSAAEALTHAGIGLDAELDIQWVQASEMTSQRQLEAQLAQVHGILMPGSMGEDAGAGHQLTVTFARERGIPFLGLCTGFEAAVLQALDDVHGDVCFDVPGRYLQCHQPDKTTPVRLGDWNCDFKPESKWAEAYGTQQVRERHRHERELIPQLAQMLEESGLCAAGCAEDGFIHAIESAEHPFFLAAYFHPEFRSRPNRPSPVYTAFVQAALRRA